MHEYFQLGSAVRAHLPDFLQIEFSGEHDAAEAELRQLVHAFGRGDVHLRGGVELERREMVADKASHAEILHDESVGTDRGQVFEELVHAVAFALLENGVDCHVELALHAVQGFDRCLELRVGEVGRAQARVEVLEPQVHRVGAFADSGVQGFHGPGGSEYFDRIHAP